ncbi:MAG: hypothetical protein ACREC9_00270 [Methylocella sp.]
MAVFIYGLAPSDASAAIGGVTGGGEGPMRATGLGKRPMLFPGRAMFFEPGVT